MTQNTSPLRALLNVEASASVPKLSNAQMLHAPENSAIVTARAPIDLAAFVHAIDDLLVAT